MTMKWDLETLRMFTILKRQHLYKDFNTINIDDERPLHHNLLLPMFAIVSTLPLQRTSIRTPLLLISMIKVLYTDPCRTPVKPLYKYEPQYPHIIVFYKGIHAAHFRDWGSRTAHGEVIHREKERGATHMTWQVDHVLYYMFLQTINGSFIGMQNYLRWREIKFDG